MEVTLHVEINNIPNSYFEDVNYDDTREFIIAKLQEITDGIEGYLYDFEIK